MNPITNQYIDVTTTEEIFNLIKTDPTKIYTVGFGTLGDPEYRIFTKQPNITNYKDKIQYLLSNGAPEAGFNFTSDDLHDGGYGGSLYLVGTDCDMPKIEPTRTLSIGIHNASEYFKVAGAIRENFTYLEYSKCNSDPALHCSDFLTAISTAIVHHISGEIIPEDQQILALPRAYWYKNPYRLQVFQNTAFFEQLNLIHRCVMRLAGEQSSIAVDLKERTELIGVLKTIATSMDVEVYYNHKSFTDETIIETSIIPSNVEYDEDHYRWVNRLVVAESNELHSDVDDFCFNISTSTPVVKNLEKKNFELKLLYNPEFETISSIYLEINEELLPWEINRIC